MAELGGRDEGEYDDHGTLCAGMKCSSMDKNYFSIYKKAASPGPPKIKITAVTKSTRQSPWMLSGEGS